MKRLSALLALIALALPAVAQAQNVNAQTGTAANLAMAAGDRLGVVWANAIQSSVGVTVSVAMIPQ